MSSFSFWFFYQIQTEILFQSKNKQYMKQLKQYKVSVRLNLLISDCKSNAVPKKCFNDFQAFQALCQTI